MPDKNPSHERRAFVSAFEKIIGLPYQWGGESLSLGFDCSGAVRYAWVSAGYRMDQDMTANEMCRKFWEGCYITQPEMQVGDLLFYGTVEKIDHVMIAFRRWPNGRFILAGARGGGPATDTYDEAYASWALVDLVEDTYWSSNLQLIVDPFLRYEKLPASEDDIAHKALIDAHLEIMQYGDKPDLGIEKEKPGIVEKAFPWIFGRRKDG